MGGVVRFSGISVARRNSAQIYIKGGRKVEIGSEVIIAYAKISFENGLLICLI